MAVSAMQNNTDCTNSNDSFRIKNFHKTENVERNSESSGDFTDSSMKQAKKTHKKPEQQIYRPGMGLHNRNTAKSEEPCRTEKKVSPEIDLISTKSAINVIPEEKSNPSSISKVAKSRRPDLQVYTPKQKVLTKANEVKSDIDLDPSLSHKGEYQSKKLGSFDCDEINKKKKNSGSRRRNSVTYTNSNEASKKDVILSSFKSSPSSSPQTSESWADLVEDSDLSNARSTPDEKLSNGYAKEKVESNSTKSFHNRRDNSRRSSNGLKQKIDDVSEKKITKNSRNSNRNGKGEASRSVGLCYEDKSSDKNLIIDRKMRDFSISNSLETRSNDNNYTSYCRSRTVSGSSSNDNIRENGISLKSESSFYRGKDLKGAYSDNDARKLTHGFSKVLNVAESDKYGVNTNQIKNDKKNKHEKLDQPVAPRFQKNKLINADSHSNSILTTRHFDGQNAGGGGILKLPNEMAQVDKNSDIFEDNMCIPKIPSFQEPQVFIHKTLFDPNNPDKPEIVNIPANPVPAHLSFSNINNNYYTSDSNCPPYISAPVQKLGYIPPPQPPPVPPVPQMNHLNHHYRYMHSEVHKPIPLDNYISVNEAIAPPVQCPIPDSRIDVAYTRSTIRYNEYQVPVPMEPVKKRLKPIVEKNLQDIVVLERELTSLITKQTHGANLNALKQCRWKLQLRYENIILADPKYCAEKNTEQSLWKSAFHQIIESLRKKLDEDTKNQEETKENLLNIILEGTVFYENLLEKQQETYGFNLQRLLEMEQISNACIPEQIRVVLISTQKILIYLGDLARYKEQTNQTANYGKARNWYLKAQQLVPKNGKPYHQLAVLAQCTNRKLDAVYYYMRSLAASNAFLSAKESLLSLFEDVKRKFEQYERKRVQDAASDVKFPIEENNGKRCEVWIKRDGSSSHLPTIVEKTMESAEIKNLPDVELNKRFVTSFLHVHGKLFTKVGMDTFHEALKQMLKEFYFLLQRTPIPIGSSRLLQLCAINIFAVANSSMKGNGRENGGSSVMQEQALYTGMVMMSMIMERCQMLHVAHKSSPEYSNQLISDDFDQLLPSVKIWTDWMSCQKCLWSPPPSNILGNLNLGYKKNVWDSFADLLTTLHEIDTSNPMILSERKEGCELVVLEEDCSLSGFLPLLGALQEPAYAMLPFDKTKAKNCLRINRIQFFGDYLCGITPPYLEFDVEHKKFVSLLNLSLPDVQYERSAFLNSSTDDSFGDDGLDDDLIKVASSGSNESSEIQLLWSRKEALSKAKERQEEHRAQVQAVLHKHQSQLPIVINIQPRYLIPDTNCFIDHLKLLDNMLLSSSYHIIVPLIVINELDGLARGTRVNSHSSPEHSNRVTALSQEAVTFLEEKFAHRHPHLRAITSKGSVLDTISFRSEEMEKNKGTNDDLILSCCLYYCKDKAKLYMPKNHGEPIQLFREVVLLTDDRNLRIKALAHNVPVRDLLSFLQWANS